MELTREQVNVAVSAGLALTNPEDEKLYCPMKHLAGTLVLRQLLMSMANGQIGLTSTMQQAPPPKDDGKKEEAPKAPVVAKKKRGKK